LNNGPAFAIDARNLAIDHGIFDLQMFRDPGGKFSETAEYIPLRETNSPLPSASPTGLTQFSLGRFLF
jgi:hypothetical protein